MESLLGFRLDAWGYLTFLALFIVGAGFIALIYLILGLVRPYRNRPGGILMQRPLI
jgi:ABC-type uncharacterized transport system permease subunit